MKSAQRLYKPPVQSIPCIAMAKHYFASSIGESSTSSRNLHSSTSHSPNLITFFKDAL